MNNIVKFVDNHNGRFLVVVGDQWIRHGIENVDLIGVELRKFSQLLSLAKKLRPFQKDIIDGGSNMGSWTIPIAREHGDLVFHMFEVQRFLYHVSCGNLALNHVLNARANLMGLGNTNTMMEVFVPDYQMAGNFGSFELQPPWQNSDCKLIYMDAKDHVPIVTLDSLNLSPLLIKLDLEGMEWLALQGAEKTIDQYLPIVWCERQKSNADWIIPWFTNKKYAHTYAIEGHWCFLPSWLVNNPHLASCLS